MYQPEWLKYSSEERLKLMEHFNLKASLSVEVFNSQLAHDGVPPESYYEITTDEADKVLAKPNNPKSDDKKDAKEEPKAKPKKKRVVKKRATRKPKKDK